MQSLASRGGLLALPGRLARPSRARLTPVLAAKGKSTPPAEAPAAAPADIPAYFQPAPVPQQGQEVYQAVPQYSGPPAPPAKDPSFFSNIPPLVYIGVGVVLAAVLNKVMALVKGGPQKMQEMMMQQMMQQMMKQMGAPPTAGGASPFGGANPFAAAGGASPFGAAGGANPFGAGGSPFGTAPSSGGSGFPGGFPPMQPAFDTTATPAAKASAAGTSSTTSSGTSSSSSKPAAGESSGGSASGDGAKKKKRSAFTDVKTDGSASSSAATDNASSSGAAADSSSSTAPPPPFTMPGGGAMPPFTMPGGGAMPPPPFSMPLGGGGGAGAGTAGAPGVAGTMLDMLKNPEMQKMLYPYLPEPMRNQETFEWMLSNPEYRAQLEGMLQQQAAATGSSTVQEMLQGMDMSPEKMQAQFDQLGMTPDQFIGKVMADPDLAGMMTNPKIMTAIAECTKNPMAIFQYQNDPEVMRVFEKMSTLFPQAAAGGALPNMPPGFGPPSQQ